MKIGDQNNDCNIDKLNKADSLKHALSLFIDCMIALKLRYLHETDADDTIDDNDKQRGGENHEVLLGIVNEPVLAVLYVIRLINALERG